MSAPSTRRCHARVNVERTGSAQARGASNRVRRHAADQSRCRDLGPFARYPKTTEG